MGSSSAVPRPGRACSCYLVESAGSRIAIEFGSGALQSMRRFVECADLDAIVISHLHADHYLDLVPLRYALLIPPTNRDRPLDVHVPPGALARIRELGRAISPIADSGFFEPALRFHEYDPAQRLAVGDLRIDFARTVHYIDAYAMRISNADAVLTYSTDTAPCDTVIDLARGADIFLCECSLGALGADRDPRGHSNAREAGEMAGAAGAKHLVLTHYGTQSDPSDLLSAAARSFQGRITVADDGLLLEL